MRRNRFVFILLLAACIQALTTLRVEAADSDPLVLYTTVAGNPTQIEVFLRAGADPAIAGQMLRAAHVNAVPSDLFFTSGYAWPEFLDHGRQNNFVTQSYNPSGDTTGGGALTAMLNAQHSWSNVSGATFRYAFGGTTTRCPSLSFSCPGGLTFDGHNDVGWGLLPSGILGVTTTGFNRLTGAAVESDTVLSTAYQWFTNGQDVDVESIMLHEFGHVAGLAHSPDPKAVMYAFYGGVKRVLTAVETDGLEFIYPLKPSVVSQTPSAFDFRMLAALGDAAPGGGTYLDSFQVGSVNGSGDASFVADVPEGEALFVTRKGTAVQVVRSGQAVPGGALGPALYDNFALNDGGEMAFSWPLASDVDGNPSLFHVDAKGGVHAIVQPGLTPAPGGGIFTGTDSAALSNGGDIAFAGGVDTLPDLGIFVARKNGTITAVARPGDAAPGGTTFVQAVFPSIGNGGDVAFRALVANRPSDGVYVWHAGSNAIEAIAQAGDPAPGGGVFMRATIPRVNARGDVLFLGRLQQGTQFVYGLYLASRGTVVAIAKPGDVMPDGWGLNSVVLGETSATLNDSGDVAFVAQTVQRETGLLSGAVYASSHGALRLVARVGSVILGAGLGLTSVSPPVATAVIDNRGNVVIQVQPMFGNQELLEAGPKAQ